ncbi:MAG: ABC transporter permease [Actinomycetaceae bacterium]|nr:ABC transporter permease [Arcanobacterium sp.]MDD7504810.1 ABC transporter permease [Actinomycetaceae bacterium]MDY6142661.1 oligopeptide ABC transporter permease OppC [Arcanobacterium sp.]
MAKKSQTQADQTHSARTQHSPAPQITAESFAFQKLDKTASEHIAAPRYSYWRSVFRRFFASKVAIVMLVIMVAVLAMSFIHPIFSQYDNMQTDFINDRSQWFQRPSLEHPFGTDEVGRELFDAVWAGARTSLFIAMMTTLIIMVVGVIVGMFWGFSKRVDVVMIEVYNVVSNIPFMLIVMVLAFAFGPGVWQLIFAMSCTTWVSVAYFIRVQVMIIRDREYNLASQTLGSSTPKIINHNIFPYLISVLMTLLSRYIPEFISTEVALSYLGVGLTQELPSLGRIVQTNARYMMSTPYLFVIPLIITALISISLYIVGQTLADASDPRNHRV